jgi:hypothetical protein
MTQGLLGALVADTAPEPLRGKAFGVFHLVSGIAMLIASIRTDGDRGLEEDARAKRSRFRFLRNRLTDPRGT